MKKVGILGGGQLGMLLSQSVICLGGEAVIFDPDSNAPAAKGVRQFINASWHDKKALSLLFQECDVITYEFENVPASILTDFINSKPILPGAKVLEITQNRALEKEFLQAANLPHVKFRIAHDLEELSKSAQVLPLPVIVKSTTGGYDGKSQHFIDSKEALSRVVAELKVSPTNGFPLVIEEAIDLQMEVSCIVAINQAKEEYAFPLFENRHANHILDTTLVPARVPQAVQDRIVELALSAARQLKVIGLLCTEFFIAKTKTAGKAGSASLEHYIYINEFAPRPHNSGHVTINACSISQFDALARILLDIPLSQPRLLAPGYFCMANLLGDIWLKQNRSETGNLNLSALKANKDVIDLIIYGKKEPRPLRKMGHFITYDQQAEKALTSALAFKSELSKEV